MSDRALTREQIRQIDQIAIEQFGVPGAVLMENAARQVADQACAMLKDPSGTFLILCGGGNNGGDGFAAARHLILRGHAVRIITTKPFGEYRGDAAINLAAALKLDLPVQSISVINELTAAKPADLIIDALLGTGLTQPVRGLALDVIQWMNDHPALKLAVDVPSGLDCDTGQPLGDAVRAAQTITFYAMKVGLLEVDAKPYTGEVHIADIGVPRDIETRRPAGGG